MICQYSMENQPNEIPLIYQRCIQLHRNRSIYRDSRCEVLPMTDEEIIAAYSDGSRSFDIRDLHPFLTNKKICTIYRCVQAGMKLPATAANPPIEYTKDLEAAAALSRKLEANQSTGTTNWELRTPLRYGSKHEGFYAEAWEAEAAAKSLGYEKVNIVGKVIYAEDDENDE